MVVSELRRRRTVRRALPVGGRRRTYLLVTDVSAGPTPPAGLVLVLHGAGGDGARFRATTRRSFDRLAAPGRPVAYLDGHDGHWNDARRELRSPARAAGCDDVAFARAVADAHAGGGPVRGVGFSNGGQLLHRIVHEDPSLLAAMAVLSATLPAPGNFLLEGARPGARPTLLVHGTRDRLAPLAGGRPGRRGAVGRGPVRSLAETAAYLAAANGITDPPVTTHPAPGLVRVEHRQAGRPPVVAIIVEGGGHAVPCGRTRWSPSTGFATRHLVAADAAVEVLGLAGARPGGGPGQRS